VKQNAMKSTNKDNYSVPRSTCPLSYSDRRPSVLFASYKRLRDVHHGNCWYCGSVLLWRQWNTL